MTQLPWTPDFDIWPIEFAATACAHRDDVLSITWSDGATSQFHALLLRENSPDPNTIHPKAREMCLSPTEIADDLTIISAGIEANGAVSVQFSDGTRSEFHPGWLRGVSWFGEEKEPEPVLWRGEDLPEPPTFDGPEALENPHVFLQWLEALARLWSCTPARIAAARRAPRGGRDPHRSGQGEQLRATIHA